MREFILHIYDWLQAHKTWALIILLMVLILSALSAFRLHFQENITDFLPAKEQEKLNESGGDGQMALFFTGGTVDNKLEAMYAFSDSWNAAHEDIPITPEADNASIWTVFDFLSANWPYFLEEQDYARMDSLLATPGYVAQKMQENKQSLYASSLQARYMRTDPLGFFSPVLQRLNKARPASQIIDNCLFTADGETGIVLFHSPYGSSESGKNATLIAALQATRGQIHAQYPDVTITSTGAPEVAVENARTIKKDALLALSIAILFIAVILWFSYRRLSDVLWILLSIGAGALFALGIIGLFKSSVSLIVLGIGSTIIGIAVNYPLHYVDHLKYQTDKRKALAEQVNPLLVGNITTVGAFLSLLLMKADALHDFGFIAAIMLVGTILFVLLFLPVFIPQRKGTPQNLIKLDFDRYLHPGPNSRRSIFLAFTAATIFLCWQSRKVGFDANLHNINYMTQEQKDGFAMLEGLRMNASAFPLPSREEQVLRINRWNAFWEEHQPMLTELEEEGLKAGFTPHAFQPFWDALDLDWQPRERSYFKAVDFAPETNVAQALIRDLSQDFGTIGLLCSLIVFLFLWISFGSLALSLLAFLPLAVSWYWIQGIMGLSGLQFNIVNVILATFIFGMGDDYSIFITEGLLYERATGKKILHSYKNAVVLSALIMFVGIGALVLARHPAMHSLGLVTVIGMLTVVGMAYYLPPLVFRWLTTKDGAPRKTPLTLGNILRTSFIGISMVLTMTLLSLVTVILPSGVFFNRIIRRTARWAIHLVPGCPFKLHNPGGEDFSRPAVYICNHQSHLDVLALIALQPKLIFMTNDWVWKFPLYGAVIRKAGYFPASWGLSRNSAHVKELVGKGYSIVIFPEGTRSEDGGIQRFHRGAFATAQELGLDILPLCIHGFHDALPKHHFLLRQFPLYLEVGERVQVTGDVAAFTREMRHFYVDWYAHIRSVRESAAWLAPIVKEQYLYKGHDALLECRRVLRKSRFAQIDALEGEQMEIRNAGCGVEALLIALRHPQMQITAYEADEEKYLTATRCAVKPSNLHYLNTI